MRFEKDWYRYITDEDKIIYLPVIEIWFQLKDGKMNPYRFIIDSGADISLGPHIFADILGLAWEKGKRVNLKGISKKKVCWVEGRIHEVDIIVPEVAQKMRIPICLAKGEAPLLVGREGFFDYFAIEFDKSLRKTIFKFKKEAL